MAINFQCHGCHDWFEVPDHAAGETVACPACDEDIVVPMRDAFSEPAPMILDDDEEDEFSDAVTEPDLPSATYVATVDDAHLGPAVAVEEVPMVDVGSAPSRAVAAAIPQQMQFDDENADRARSLSRPAIVNYTLAGVIVAGLLLITVLITLQRNARPNPLPSTVGRQLTISQDALAYLSNPQDRTHYSFQLPKNFVPTKKSPSVEGMPKGTIAHRWDAIKGVDKGSTFQVWVVPKILDIEKELEALNNFEERLGYPTRVYERSDYFRVGNDFVGMRGLVDGDSDNLARQGVVYVLADDDNTVIVLAMAVGPWVSQGQGVLDASSRSVKPIEVE